METNKEITEAKEIIIKHCGLPDRNNDIDSDIRTVVDAMHEYLQLHLSKQAEFIAEKAEMKKYKGHYSINKQSIINAGEEYKNSVK